MADCSGECSSCNQSGSCEEEVKKNNHDIKNYLMVMSGKGGVGKSSVSVNLAAELTNKGCKVGVLDIDFHGPSIPTLLGLQGEKLYGTENSIIPFDVAGIKVVSVGLMVSGDSSAVIWRGPMKASVIKQFLDDVEWGDLDYLIMDFPPGTGDEALTAAQTVVGHKSAVVVTTPQEVSLADCRRCIDFCRQLKLPVSGVVENMSGFTCSNCDTVEDIFGSGGGEKMAFENQVPFLGSIPMDKEFMKMCDNGRPYMSEYSDTKVAESYKEIVKSLSKKV